MPVNVNAKAAPATERKKITSCTWEELARHNTKEDCWISVDGKIYDVTEWIPKHPGGEDLLCLSAGRDCTNLFESYHLTNKPAAILEKYCIGSIKDHELPKYTVKSNFYATLKQRIVKKLEDAKVDPQQGWKVWARLGFVYAFFAFAYYFVHFGTTSTSVLSAIGCGLLLGLAEVFFSMHILHDASHAALSHSPLAWKLIGASYEICVGANFYSWLHQHVIGHHLYTNVRGADPDLGEGDVDFRRISPAQKWRPFYQYQHIYAPILYGLLGFKYRMQDWQVYVWRKNGQIRVLNPPTFFVVLWVLGKFVFLVGRLIVPLAVMSFSRILLMFFIAEFTLGYYLAFVFQVSHVAPGLDFHHTPMQPEPAQEFEEDWAISQVRTTQDYGHGSFLTTFLTGALNYQTIHHLFPTIAQDHYPLIAPVVVDTCKEFGIEFKVLSGFPEAFGSHIQHLKDMGAQPEEEKKAAEAAQMKKNK
eukprot:TRINITY_DN12724_c0_g1_i1.p1 TRINITY_DN12724_c0_g1~~TRINITY_DN12724_c0_g1_i1.p1  ORF type:complete len:474 (+),score=177.29 TRINITY_DN12724_c0_g1_i1:106-1527(+)